MKLADWYILIRLLNYHHHHHHHWIFLLTCRYRGHIHNSGPPSRQLACCTHDRSHTRSPINVVKYLVWVHISHMNLCQIFHNVNAINYQYRRSSICSILTEPVACFFAFWHICFADLRQTCLANAADTECYFNPIALRKAKIARNFGLSECNRVKKSSPNQAIDVS